MARSMPGSDRSILFARRGRLFGGDLYRGLLRSASADFDVRLELVQLLPDDALQFWRRRLQPVVRNQRQSPRLAAGPVNHEHAFQSGSGALIAESKNPRVSSNQRHNFFRRIHTKLRESLFR